MHTLKLVDKIEETPDVISFIFESQNPFEWVSGQFLKYKLEDPDADDRGVNRFFTIASSPAEKHIQMTTRIFDRSSTFKHDLTNLQVGDAIEAEGPRGSFTYPDIKNEIFVGCEVVFIAGGIGVTPFRSILFDLDSKYLCPKITMLYANRDNSQVPFKELFNTFAQKNSNLNILYHEGQITDETLRPLIKSGLFYYVSGPEPLVEKIVKMLEDMGIEKSFIKTDFFPGYEDKL